MIATQVANEFGFPTIGVFPLTAKDKHSLPLKAQGANAVAKLDLAVCVHPLLIQARGVMNHSSTPRCWTASSSLVAVPARWWRWHTSSNSTNGKESRKKHIIPVYGTGGTADKLSFFPGKPKTMATCIPSHPITSGREVCQYLLEQVVTDDIYEPPFKGEEAKS